MTPKELKEVIKQFGNAEILAEEIGVSPRTIEGWVQGRVKIPEPTKRLIIKLMEEINGEIH